MRTKNYFRKIITGIILLSFFLSSTLIYSPVIVKAEENEASLNPNSSTVGIPYRDPNKKYSTQSSANTSGTQLDDSNQTSLSQEDIDKIVNDHLQIQENNPLLDSDNKQELQEEKISEDDYQKTDRFIIKYKNENIKEQTINKLIGNINKVVHTKNNKFDVVITKDKIKKEDLSALIKQKKADTNIEYIQPDYQVTVASVEDIQNGTDEITNTTETTEGQTDTDTQPDTAAPFITSSTFYGLKITFLYNENLNSNFLPISNDFTVQTLEGQNTEISTVEIVENQLIITLSSTLTAGESVIVSYLPGENPLQDEAGNLASGFSNTEVINTGEAVTDTIPPTVEEAVINASSLVLSFNEQIQGDSLPDPKDFILTINGETNENTIKGIKIIGTLLKITLTTAVNSSDIVKISYVPGEKQLTDEAGNIVEGFTDLEVENITIISINDPNFSDQWGLLSNTFDQITNLITTVGINAFSVWEESKGKGVIVAVLDSGIDITHEDLQNNIWINTAEIPDNGLDDDGNGYIDDINGWNFPDNGNAVHSQETISDEWHGTHVAGIIAAEMNNEKGIAGVAPEATIMPLQVFKNGTAYTSDIINAIHYAEQNGAQIVNCSWGTISENTALKEAIENSSILFVCAAGNCHVDIDANPIYPASLTADNIISVGSVKENGNLSGFSNYGLNSVDVVAPGENILSTAPRNEYKISGGTSQAAAFVTGEAALILSKYTDCSLSDIKSRIVDSCNKLSSLTGKTAGGGIIDCKSALEDPVRLDNHISEVQEEGVIGSNEGVLDNGDYDLYSVNEWNTMAGGLARSRRSFGTVAFNNKIYCVGGYEGSQLLSAEVYEPESGTSTLLSNMSEAREGLTLAATDKNLYAIGGYNSNSGYKNTIEAYDPTTNTWSIRANMPTARRNLGSATVNGIIYVIGGTNGLTNGSNLNTVEAYDPETNTWSTRASMPTARNSLGVVACNGKIYAIGGLTNTVEVYDPGTNIWVTKTSMPVAKYAFGIAENNGKIYVVGGGTSGYNTTYEYNTESDLWTLRPSLATGRDRLGAASVNGKIYAIGGHSNNELSVIEEYGPPASNWKLINNMSTPRADLGSVSFNGKIYAIGGYDGTNYLNTVEEYDKTTNTWATKANMPTARAGMGIEIVDGNIYCVGGFNGSYLKKVEVYNPLTDTWITKNDIPTTRAYFGLTNINRKLYAVGGYIGNSNYLRTVLEYDPSTDVWTNKASMSLNRGYLGVVSYNGKIYAIGGYNGNYLNAVEEYNPSSNSWTTKTGMPGSRKDLGVVVTGGQIYAIGGYAGSYLNITQKFDPKSNTWTTLDKEIMITSKSRFSLSSLDGKIYSLGGYNGLNYSKEIVEYLPKQNSWSIKKNMPYAKYGFGSTSLNGKIYAIGGYNEDYESSVFEYDFTSDSWNIKTDMPTTRTGLGVIVLNGKIYAIGGYNGNYLSTLEIYDPIQNTWTTKQGMSVPRKAFGLASAYGKLYVFGGYNGQYLNTLEEYDPLNDVWTTKANMPTARAYLTGSSIDGNIYGFGGTTGLSYLNTVEEYNPLTNSWSTKNSMLTARMSFGTVYFNGKVYAAGGYADYLLNKFEEYDPKTNSWSEMPDMPVACTELGIANGNGKIFVMGGKSGIGANESCNTVQEYDLETLTWETKISMPTSRESFGITTANGKIYSIYGCNGNGHLQTIEEYDPVLNTWNTKATSYIARYGLGAATVNNQIYAIGGYYVSGITPRTEMYDPVTDTLTIRASMNISRLYPGVVALNGKIYSIGGRGLNNNYLNSIEEYEPLENTWTIKANMPTARCRLALAVVDGKIYAIGGYNGNYLNCVEVYDPVTDTWSAMADMPTSRASFGTAVVNDRIYILGGSNGTNSYLDNNEVFDPIKNCWTVQSDLPTARGYLGAAEVNDKIYVIGGKRYNGSTIYLNTVEAYDPIVDSYTLNYSNLSSRSGLSASELNGIIYAVGGENDVIKKTTEAFDGNTWSTLTDMNTARRDFGLISVDNFLYAIGGYDGSKYLSSIEVFNPETNQWSFKTSMNTPRSKFGIVTVNGRIYVIGGYNGSELNSIEEYNPTTDTWINRAALPTARYGLSATSLNGIIYAIGGMNNLPLNTVEVYDPISDVWSSTTSMLMARTSLGVATIQGKIYAIGGYDGSNYLSIVEEFDPIVKAWSQKSPLLNARAQYGIAVEGNGVYLIGGSNDGGLVNSIERYVKGDIIWRSLLDLPTARFDLSAAELEGKIYVIGGNDTIGNTCVTEVYDPTLNNWSTITPMNTARSDFGVATSNGKIYAIGGNRGNALNIVEEYDHEINSWNTTTKTPMQTSRYSLGVVSMNGKIYGIGGNNGSTSLDTVEEYDPINDSWTTKASMHIARDSFGIVTVNGKIYVIGGYNGNELSSVEEYDPLTNIWTIKTSMPTARYRLEAIAVDGKIYAIGGHNNTNNIALNVVEVYDPITNSWKIGTGMPNANDYFAAVAINEKIYIIGGIINLHTMIEGSFESEDTEIINEMIHYGEENINFSGNFSRTYVDMTLKTCGFTIDLTRTYNSRDDQANGYFGKGGWTFGFQGSLVSYQSNNKTKVIIRLPNGSGCNFTKNTDGSFISEDSRSVLTQIGGGTYLLTTKDQYSYWFENGKLYWLKDRNGNKITLSYSYGKVSAITDQLGRQINIVYNTDGYIESIIDQTGRAVHYEYENMVLVRAIDPRGIITSYTYDENNYLTEIRDNDNKIIESVVYDTSYGTKNLKISRLTDANGNIKNYLYSTDLNKVIEIDSNGHQKITWFDDALYPIQVQDPDGRRSSTIYDLDANNVNKYGQISSNTNRNGNKTVYIHDDRGNITKICNPDTSYQEFSYDNKNNKLWEKDEDGKYTFYMYDTNGINLLKKAQPLNGTDQYYEGCNESIFAITTYTYYTYAEAQAMGCNAYGLLKTETDPNGYTTTYTYDAYGNVHTVVDPENKTTTYTYNNLGWKTGMQTPKGYTTSYVYDNNGNLEKETLQGEDTSTTRITYDNMGRKTKEVTPNLYNASLDNIGNHTYSGDQGYRYTYYSNGEIHTETDLQGNITTYRYDLYGNVSTETKQNGSIIEYFYDNLNRLSTVRFKDSETTTPVVLSSYSYQILADGKTKKIETKYLNDTETAVTQYTYDYEDRLVRQDNQDGTYTTVSYNLNGTIDHTTDARRYSTYYKYDGLNRNTRIWIPSVTENGNTLYTYKGYIYDKVGNILSEKTGKTTVALYDIPADINCIIITKEYYDDDSLKSETDSAGQKTEYFYDDDGGLIQKDVYTSAAEKITTEYVNNYLNKPVQEKLHVRAGDLYGNNFSSDTNTILTTAYTYDKNGNVLTVTRPDIVVTTYTYDNLNRLLSTSMPGINETNNAVTITTSQTYDWSGKVLTQTDANGHTTTYEYDKRERLIKVTDAKDYSSACYYDRSGRLIAEVAPNNYDPAKILTQMSRTEYTYDQMGRVKTKSYTYIDPVTIQWVTFVASAYKYDENGNKIKELDALGYESGTGSTVDDKINSGYGTIFTYDPDNRLLTTLDPVSQQRSLSFTTKYAYDSAGRKTSETNAKGIVTAYTYDDADNLLTTTTDSQTVQTNTYDLNGNLLTQTDGNGNTITYTYNAFGKLKQVVYPGDSSIPACTITCQYDTNGNLKKKESTAGVVDLYTYNNQGRELSHTQQKTDQTQGITTSSRYDKAGNLRYAVDGNNVTAEYVYDEINRKTQSKITVTNVNNISTLQTTTYGYDAAGNQTTQTDWLENTYTNIYDPLSRLIEKKDPLNKSIEKLTYNNNSSQITSTDALNKTTQFTYDRNNRKLSTIDPLNHAVSQTYDDVGNISTKTDGKGNVTTYHYDDFNRLASIVNDLNETTSYTYDLNGNVLTQTDGLNHTTTFEYNVANKLVKKIDHGGRTGTYPNYVYDASKVESYTYDASGNMLTRMDRNGNTTTWTYDVHNRILSQVSGSLTVSYTYDGNGNRLTMTDNIGTTTRTYDELNRTKTKIVPGVTGTMTFLYDVTTGLPTGQVAETDTDQKANTTTKVFDQAGRMISVTAGGQTTTYTYYDNGSKHTVLYPDGSNEAYTYYDDGMLHSLLNLKADQTVIDAYSYNYDAAHNITSKVDGRGTTTYTYDDLNRLLTVTEPSGKITAYTFDQAGNRFSQTETLGANTVVTTYTYNNQNRLTNTLTQENNITTQTVAYTYDNNGNQLIITKVPYVNGIPQTPLVTTCTYDRFNQLLTTDLPDGTDLSYAYNGEGLRVTKQVNSTPTKYVYVGDKVVLELDGANNQLAFNVHGTNLIARTVSGTTLYYMYNGHADVTVLVNSSGTVQATYYYDAFGNILEQTGTFNNNITYAGYQYDQESNLYYLNSRYYDPVTARFLSEDTYGGDPNDPLSLNRYTYCHNEPLMYTDPTGHVNIYGNPTDLASAESSLGDDGYTYIDTSSSDWNGIIESGSIVVGGTAAVGGVGANVDITGSIRLGGANRQETASLLTGYKSTTDVLGRNTSELINIISQLTGGYYSNLSSEEQAEMVTFYKFLLYSANIYSGEPLKSDSSYGMGGPDGIVPWPEGTGSGTISIQAFTTNNISYQEFIKTLIDIKNDPTMQQYRLDKLLGSINNPSSYFNNISDQDFEKVTSLLNTVMVDEIGYCGSIEHYFRTSLNHGVPQKLSEMVQLAKNGKWELLDVGDSILHMYGDKGEYNLKFVSADGHFEAVYDINGNLVTNELNMGTYNYVSPKNGPGHAKFDVISYSYLGNTPNSIPGMFLPSFYNQIKYDRNDKAQAHRQDVINQINSR